MRHNTTSYRTFSNWLVSVCLWLIAVTAFGSVADDESALPVLRYDVSASSAWYPYFIPKSEQPGIVAELVKAILKEASIEGQQMALPPKRTVYALTTGELDFDITSPSWFPNNRIPDGFLISDGMIEIKEYVVTLPENVDTYSYPDAIESKVVGTVHGYDYQNAQSFVRLDFKSELKLVEALAAGRIDAAILGDLPALYWAEKTNTDIAFGILNSKGDLHLRISHKNAHLLPRINAAIARLKQRGAISEIVSNYLDIIPNNDWLATQTADQLRTDDNPEEFIHPAN